MAKPRPKSIALPVMAERVTVEIPFAALLEYQRNEEVYAAAMQIVRWLHAGRWIPGEGYADGDDMDGRAWRTVIGDYRWDEDSCDPDDPEDVERCEHLRGLADRVLTKIEDVQPVLDALDIEEGAFRDLCQMSEGALAAQQARVLWGLYLRAIVRSAFAAAPKMLGSGEFRDEVLQGLL